MMTAKPFPLFSTLLIVLSCPSSTESRKCARPPVTTPDEEVILSPHPSSYLSPSELPTNFDWRFYSNSSTKSSNDGREDGLSTVNLCNRALTQQAPHVCGSCWAEAATGTHSLIFNLTCTHIVMKIKILLPLASQFFGGEPLMRDLCHCVEI